MQVAFNVAVIMIILLLLKKLDEVTNDNIEMLQQIDELYDRLNKSMQETTNLMLGVSVRLTKLQDEIEKGRNEEL